MQTFTGSARDLAGIRLEEEPEEVQAQKIHAAQVRHLYETGALSAVSSMVVAGALVVVLYGTVPVTWLGGWLAAMVVLALARLVLTLQYRRRSPPVEQASRWGRYYTLTASLSGTVWGMVGLFPLISGSMEHLIYIVFALGGVAAGATVLMAWVLPANLAFVIPSLLPVAALLYGEGGRVYTAMAIMLVLFGGVLVLASRHFSIALRHSLQLNLDNDRLIKTLMVAKKSADALTGELRREVDKRRQAQDKLSEFAARLEAANARLKKEIEQGRHREMVMAKQARKVFQSDARNRALLASARDGIITFDDEGVIDSVNPAAEQVFGYKDSELIGARVTSLLPDLEQEREQTDFGLYTRRNLARVTDDAHELIGLRKDGSRFPVEMSVGTMDSGKRVMYVGVFRDITDRKQGEAGLIAAMEQAEQANRAKSEFLSSMSHELRTPMNAILGFGQLLQSDQNEPLTPAQAENVEAILKAGWHLLELINEVLDLSRIESGTLNMNIEPVDLIAVLRECMSLVEPLAARRNISLIDTASGSEPVYVRGDATRVKQVLLNLLSNAVKYNRENGHVSIDPPALNGRMVRLYVTDTGPGLTREQQERIFEPFNRLDRDGGNIEGTGIGLTIGRRLMDMMGGQLGVESEPGQGSAFWIDLPASSGEELDVQTSTTAPGRGGVLEEPDRPASVRLLYIEDDEANVKLVERMIKRRPEFSFVTARSAELGLKMAECHVPDLILMDINLPGMSGFDALERLRRSERLRNVPVIAISANAMPADRDRGLAAGFARYLTKPVDMNALQNAIDLVLRAVDAA